MATSVKRNWLTEHRRWEDVFSAACGVLIVLSPIIIGVGDNTAIAINTGLAGILIAMLAFQEMMWLRRWEEVAELLCGAWVIASPFALEYGGALRNWHIVLGSAVVILALFELWQDRNRKFES